MTGLFPARKLVNSILTRHKGAGAGAAVLDIGTCLTFTVLVPCLLIDGVLFLALLGCGTGQWYVAIYKFPLSLVSDRDGHYLRALDLVAEFEHVRVVAIDQLPQMDEHLPPGVEFQQHNVNDGLEQFYNEFDVVHVRCVASGVKSYRNLLQEAIKCVKPGGVAVFVEGDFDLFTEDQKTIVEPASDANPNGSWLQRWMQGACRPLLIIGFY